MSPSNSISDVAHCVTLRSCSKELESIVSIVLQCPPHQAFPKNRSELESVSRKAGAEDDVFLGRMTVNDEMAIGRHRIEAGGTSQQVASHPRHRCTQKCFDALLIDEIGRPIGVQRVAHRLTARMLGHFDSIIIHLGKAVEHPPRQFVEESATCSNQ